MLRTAAPAAPGTKKSIGNHTDHTEAPRGLGSLFESRHFDVSEEQIEELVRVTQEHEDITWDELTKQLIRSSCAFFAQEVLQGPPEFPYDGHFLVSEHHEEWDELIHNKKRILVLAPRDHGKTFFFDFAYPLWKIITQPGGSGFIFSATKEQAQRILQDIKEEIEGNPRLQWLVPRKKSGSRWSATSIQCSNGHRIYARGFGTKVRGAHPNWIVVDDGLNDESMYSEMVRKKQIDYFYSAITNMIVPGGQIIVVGTPFHAADLYGDLAQNPEYEFRKYPAIRVDPDTGEEVALWSDRYPLQNLYSKRKEIGSVRFTREFMCEPIADDMSLFPSYLFEGNDVEMTHLKLGMPRAFWEEMGVQIFMGVDFALSSSVQADYTVVFVMGLDKYGNRWIIDIIRGRGIPYQRQLSKIREIGKKYDAGLIFLEANQAQRIFGDELIRTSDLPIKLFTTGVEKNALDKGVPSLRVLLENRKFRIPRGDERSITLTNLWKDEMRNITFQEGKVVSVGQHDDLVMGCWICDQAIRAGGFSFDFGEDVDTSNDAHEELMKELTEYQEEPDPMDDFVLGDEGGDFGPAEDDESSGASGNLIDEDDPLVVRSVVPSPMQIIRESGEWF